MSANAHMLPSSAHARAEKARVKQELAGGSLSLVEVLRGPPPSARLDELLLSLPGFGESRLRKACLATKLYPRDRAAGLSEHERGRLILYLRARGWLK